jgi:hypothetical protein
MRRSDIPFGAEFSADQIDLRTLLARIIREVKERKIGETRKCLIG